MHAMSPTLFRVKGYGARWAKTAVSLCLIGIGVAIVVTQLLASIPRERLFVLGYFLALSGFAWIHRAGRSPCLAAGWRVTRLRP